MQLSRIFYFWREKTKLVEWIALYLVVLEVQACFVVTEERKNAGNERNNYRERKRCFYCACKLDAQVRHNFTNQLNI